MAGILINQDIYPELRKLGFQQTILDKFNNDFLTRVATISAPPVVGMTIEHADAVVRWAINATLGFPDVPEHISRRILPPLEHHGPLDPPNPITLGNVVGLGPIFWSPAARGLMDAAAISSRIQGGQPPPAVRLMRATTGGSEQLTTAHLLRSSAKQQKIGNVDSGTGKPHIVVDHRPDWERHPWLYNFPVGFPRTKQDMALVVQTAGLIGVFKTKTDNISQKMTNAIRSRAPSWRLPNSTSIDWSKEEERFGFLRQCDQTLYRAEKESRELFYNTLISMVEEAGLFLAATREYVFCHHKLFEDYWAGQLRSVMDKGFGYQEEFLARQRFAVDDLKTQLSQLEFNNQQRAAEAARQAEQRQDSTCSDIGDVVFWVGVVVVVGGAAILVLVTGGGAYDPYPHSGSYGPVNPNDPYIPDPSEPR
ncbi:hypothetical protein FALCPG4_013816 [Fusarium falciforme]